MHQKDRKVHTREDILAAFGRLLDVQHRLRKECPWDRKQTFESLRANTIEEVFELADALIKKDYHEIMKELGDVLEHVMFYSIIGKEDGKFDIADVCNQEADKLMFRHPFINWNIDEGEWGIENEPFHVVNPDMKLNAKGQVTYKTEDSSLNDSPESDVEVEQTWERVKQKEKDGNSSVLSGVPQSLPSIIKAYRIQDKARNVGFDWEKKEDVWDKVYEELQELKTELSRKHRKNSEKEFGDFLFSLINAARLYHLNPDNALEYTNRKFFSRFEYLERKAKACGKELADMTLDEMDKLWNEAKELETQNE